MVNIILDRDLKVQVEKLDIHKCPVKSCSKAFLDASYLADHAKHHEKIYNDHVASAFVEIDRVKIYDCDSCRKGFLNQNKFYLHKGKHISLSDTKSSKNKNARGNDNVKLYKCSECDCEFETKSTLDAHSISHEPFSHERPTQLKDHKEHQKVVHKFKKLKKNKPISNAMLALFGTNNKKQVIVPKLKPELKFRNTAFIKVNFTIKANGHQCNACSKKFPSKESAVLHYRSAHQSKRSHVRRICQEGFTQISALNAHNLVHTGARDFPYRNSPKACRTSFSTA